MAKRHATTDRDENEILEELGAEPIDPDDPSGAMTVDQSKVIQEGAVDAESIRQNRRNRDTVNKKRDDVKNVTLNEPNVLLRYEEASKLTPVKEMVIVVTRRTGTPVEWTVTSKPKNATELYAAIKAVHGRQEETAYDLLFRDSNSKATRGAGRIVMPSTLDEPALSPPPQNGQPMNPYYPYGGQPPMYAPQPQQVAGQPPPPAQPPAPQPMMPGADFTAMLAWQRQQFELWRQAQQQGRAPAAPPSSSPAPTMPAAPAAPPPGMDFAGMMELQRQQFALWQQAMQAQAAQQVAPAPQPPTPQPAMQVPFGMPPVQPPPGMVFVPGFGFVSMERLSQAITPAGAPPPPPYRGGGPQYAAGLGYGGGHDVRMTSGGPPYGGPPGPAYGAPRPKSAAEEFREAVTLIRTAVDVGREFTDRTQAPVVEERRGEEESPVRVIDAGSAKLVINTKDGSARYWETGWANMTKVLTWIGEQREAIQKANAERETKQQLPSGYVEMTPDYKPPPGYVAVPLNQTSAATTRALPAPPVHMPSPITASPPSTANEPAKRITWGMPPMPGGSETP